MDFYFRQFWTDPRLAYKKRDGVETLSVGSEFIRNIWVPDTFFVNEKQSYFHIATTSNEFIRIHHSGSITRSIRYSIFKLYGCGKDIHIKITFQALYSLTVRRLLYISKMYEESVIFTIVDKNHSLLNILLTLKYNI